MCGPVQEVQYVLDGRTPSILSFSALISSKLTDVLYQKVLKDKGIDQMIAEARETTVVETDAEHLRR